MGRTTDQVRSKKAVDQKKIDDGCYASRSFLAPSRLGLLWIVCCLLHWGEFVEQHLETIRSANDKLGQVQTVCGEHKSQGIEWRK